MNGRFLAAPQTGVQRFALEVLRRLTARAEVTLFLPAGAELPADLPSPTRIVRGRLSGPLWEQGELPRSARASEVDVALHLANAAPLAGGPHVLVLHDLIPLARPGDFRPAYRAWTRLAHVRAARGAAALATVSHWSAADIARRLEVPVERILVVPQGAAPLDAPATPEAVDAVCERYGLEGRYLLALPGGDRRKGGAFLEALWRSPPRLGVAESAPHETEEDGAAAESASHGIAEGGAAAAPVTLALVGRQHAQVHAGGGPADRAGTALRWLGSVPDEDLRALYTGAVALLHPSAAEGFGRPPLEALACGTRVVAAPYGPALEVLGDAADVVPLDAAAWRSAVRRVLDEPGDERMRRIAGGRARAALFRWDDAAGSLLELCREVVTGAALRAHGGGR